MTDTDRQRSPGAATATGHPPSQHNGPSTHLTYGDDTVYSAHLAAPGSAAGSVVESANESALLDLHRRAQETDPIPCHQNDPDLWFAESPADVEFAKTLCGSCPLRQQCFDGARERREPWGVWGGELFVSGAVVARKRPRGRPRKHPVAA